MQANRCRRPNIGDGMILVIASAVALTMTRHIEDFWSRPGFSPSSLQQFAFALEKWGLPWLVSLAWAATIVRLRRPRPSMRRLWRQPGAIALTMTIVASLFVGFLGIARWLKVVIAGDPFGIFLGGGLGGSLGTVNYFGSVLVVGSWMALALTRRFRREPSWIDGLGIAVGIAWIIAHLMIIICRVVLP